ncbi:aspartate/glutamate racemase family protein [Rhodophyticola sp. CCM32]|nr:aspartate/glutamate racemase family protein [Rhodophyticola sp. CCM32]
MGSLATIEAYTRLMQALPEKDRHVIVENLPMENVFDHLSATTIFSIRGSIQRLSTAGVKVVGIPCNTVHCYSSEIEQECSKQGIRFLSIIEQTTRAVVRRRSQKAAILATPTGAELYKTAIEDAGVGVSLPSKDEQSQINDVVRAILEDPSPTSLAIARTTLERIATSQRENGADTVILGCTELPLAFRHDQPMSFISTIDALVQGFVTEIENWKVYA